ncbi:glycoside hydrolase family 15 protein [Lentzea flaviverrucosa]|uniref:Glucoamylase (Glucan-1,4-alpha-glucosidase), GH15 family n=1 Tax=Lentzea flaviverrucosa TaxID=200379 RepID=A0A1H9HNL8_9PSEU|nr:glycoside hydrolase family 15 protein [Lentzea flaviverrucosa]RDI34527.1 GH15 family glucan-1,4-alpha-glucosidase [Lentzea flaviverrucosa]SEQ63924.1 Glucoamylase (glucan-1,4-alpha-glucosidase), GH15 family [Lentzea flaviverrucosa]
MTTPPYAPIADHGLIGDLQTTALVSTDGTVDWFCCPRFDSPSVFASLLDRKRGGFCRIRPAGFTGTGKQLYFPDTAVLITRFMTEDGTGEVIDFMPPLPDEGPTERHRLVRLVRCVRGRITFELDVAPRFDYGRRAHRTHLTDDSVVFACGQFGLVLHAVREPGDARLVSAQITDTGDLRATISLEEGQTRGIVLESGVDGPPLAVDAAEAKALSERTVRFWHEWLARGTYRGRWREAVDRSAITLKLLTYAPTGAVVAAPTAGLPEQLGGERNWDYRYTWIRDASFAVGSLLRLGFTEEAAAFGGWLTERFAEGETLRVMYAVDGSADLTEHVLDHWEGHRGSSPVRIGNDAAGQLQLDIYGELLDSVHTAHQHGLRIGHRGWHAVVELLDWLAENWNQPEEGIWETRAGRADFTYGRVMSWVAFDRAIRIAESEGKPAPVARWRSQRDRIYGQVWDQGWDHRTGAFVQRYGSQVLDASLLRMAQVGFVAPRDPLWLDALAAMESLVSDSLVRRYDTDAAPDGLRGAEGSFSLCTFNYVTALALSGRAREARLVFEKMLTYGNHVGLYAEEIAVTGEQLGNFPQAFTHLALIDAAVTLDEQLTRDG